VRSEDSSVRSAIPSSRRSKNCRICGEAKPPEDFYDGQGNTCKQCVKARAKRARLADPIKYRATRAAQDKANPDRAKVRRRSRLKRRYKLSTSQLHQMWVDQNYQCPICGTLIEFPDLPPNPLGDETTQGVVDHDHRDGHVRGLLCSACNAGLGMFVDSTKFLKKARLYLKNDRVKTLPNFSSHDIFLGE
jgi:hypothetical protein